MTPPKPVAVWKYFSLPLEKDCFVETAPHPGVVGQIQGTWIPLPLADGPMRRLYEVVSKDDAPMHHKIALLWCASRCLLLKEHLPEVAKLTRKFADEITPWLAARSRVNHWPAIADWIEEIVEGKKDSRLIGVALNATSVGNDWDDYGRNGDDRLEASTERLFTSPVQQN